MYLPFTSLLAATPLVTWLKSVPKCFVHPGIDIDTSENGAGLGTFMREPAKAGEMLFSIPTSACISVTDAALDAECGEKFLQMVESGVPRTVAIAGYLAKEYMKLRTVGLENYDGPFGAYLDILPFELGKNDHDHILWWSDEDIALMQGSPAFDDAVATRQEVEMAYSLLGDIIPEKNGLGLAVAGAFVTILSRSFFDDTQPVDKEKLIPLLDMLQHDYNPNIQYCDNDGHIEVRAAVDMEANTELLNCYNYILSPWNLFTRYGFVPGRYESPRELLINKDPIFFGSE